MRIEIHMTGKLATGMKMGATCAARLRSIEGVLGRMAGNWNGARLVPETK